MSATQWENYYRTGAVATCPTSADGGYDGEVLEAWRQFFSTLPDRARILDVGTGNGVIPLIAKNLASSLDRHWHIDGIDPVRTDPRTVVDRGGERFAGIDFHPGVAAEKLPFDDATFDAVTGNFALEYTDVPRALREIHRVLRPGGEVQFLVHHAESFLLRSAKTSVREGVLVFDETRIYRKLKRLVSMESVTPGKTQEASDEVRDAIRTLKAAQGPARQAGGGRVIQVALDAAQKLLTVRRDGTARVAALEVERAEAELRAAVRDLRDLLDRGATETAMDTIEREATAAGFAFVERLPLNYRDRIFAWQLVMSRQ